MSISVMSYSEWLLIVPGFYLSAYVLYNFVMIVVHVFAREKSCVDHGEKTHFAVIVPAHNEELLLAELLSSIEKQNYPRERFRTIVVADNCTDRTAEIGKSNGAEVLERNDIKHAGKGYAISYALERIGVESVEAVFIVDADSILNSEALEELHQAIRRGARIIQCFNGIANPDDSWFTRIMDVSRTYGNEVLEPAKEKIGLSSHLMGNGMCFVRDVIMKYGWDAFTVGEDWEYYAKVVIKGERVAYVRRARVYHRESVNIRQATSQRLRWSSGRFAVATTHGVRLLMNGLKNCSITKMDASMPLLLPNPSLGISLTLLMFFVSIVTAPPTRLELYAGWYALLGLAQLVFFLIGIAYVNNKKMKLLAIISAPIFIFWKTGIDLLSVAGVGRKSWVRTERKL